MTARLQNKVALITGAGGGIGRASARRFAAEGAKVVVSDAIEKAGRATVDEVVTSWERRRYLERA